MYTLGYAARCDYGTGVFTARMSKQAWWELLASVSDRGSKKDWNKQCGLPNLHQEPTRFSSFIRARREELERAGLIEKVSAYAYQLAVYTNTALNRLNEEHASNTPMNTRKSDDKLLNNNDSSTYEHAHEHDSSTIPHQSINQTTREGSKPTTGNIALTDAWQPNLGFQTAIQRAGFDVTLAACPEGGDYIATGKHASLYYAAMTDLVCYWLGDEVRAKEEKTQIGWQGSLLMTMKHLFKQHKADVVKIKSETGGSAAKKEGKALSGVTALIKKVPYKDKELTQWQKQYAHMGAPKAKSRADYGFQEWRTDLDTWRRTKMQEDKYAEKQQGVK